MEFETTRRDLLKAATLTGLGFWVGGARAFAAPGPNDKLGVAFVGCGGKGDSDVGSIGGSPLCRIVAMCDVDDDRAAGQFKRHPDVPKYKDFRKMLERKDIDAVVVSTPDHIHAPATIMALRAGRHVYCQKPLTHTVYEARLVTQLAEKMKVATQMGNQGTAAGGLRTAVEIVQAGAIGDVREVHVWSNRPIWPQGMKSRPEGQDPVPASLDWDLWLGPAPVRPYKKGAYEPFVWRGWWDFGSGALGDMACHTTNMPFMGLKLYESAPLLVEADSTPCFSEAAPSSSKIRFEFPARGAMPPVTLWWYDGGRKPSAETLALVAELYGSDDSKPDAKKEDWMKFVPGSGCLLIGSKGQMFLPDDYGANYKLLPQKDFEGYKPPAPTLPRSPGHDQEWILAATGKGPAPMSNFGYAGRLTEMMVLGNLAIRAGNKRFGWDSENLRCIGCPEAQPFVSKIYRKGWEIE